MDAIECGIVKLPRVPVADNIPGGDMPMFRELWQHIGKDMPKKRRGKAAGLDPLKLSARLQTALEALYYGHYEKTFNLKFPTVTDRRRAPTCPISLSWSMTATARTIRCN
jgi:type III restriction enzyme